MEENNSTFTFDDSYYNVSQLSSINNDQHCLNFTQSFVDESSLNGTDSLFTRNYGDKDILQNLRNLEERKNNEFKYEPIKSELSDLSSSGVRVSRSNSNSGTLDLQSRTPTVSVAVDYPICLKCDKCPFLCTSQSSLDAHISQDHSNIYESLVLNRQKILCPGCDNVFYVKHSLEVHLEYDHLMNNEEILGIIDKLITQLNPSNDTENRRSRIYLKNVDFLRNIPMENQVNNYENDNQEANLIDLIDDSHENSIDYQNNKISVRNANDLRNIVPISEDEATFCHIGNDDILSSSSNKNYYDLDTNAITNISSSIISGPKSPFETGERRNRPKIYIKNVDILKEPIFVPTNTFTNVLNANTDLRTLSLFPPVDNTLDQYSYNKSPAIETCKSIEFNENNLTIPKKKIYIKNVDVLRGESAHEATKKSTNSLHLRTVDELNLMNKNEVQHLFNPILGQNCPYEGTATLSSENSKNSDEIGIGKCSSPIDLEYNRRSNFLQNNDVMHMNWSNDYGFDELENIIDSSSSATSAEQKNPHYDLNTPQRSISDDQDKDLLFVCAQELINSNNIVNDETNSTIDNPMEKQSDFNFSINSNFPHIEEQEVVEILDDLEKQQPNESNNVTSIPEKGRIYVADNLIENFKYNEEDIKKKSRGRPIGSKRTWVTMIKPRNKKINNDIGFKCDQNCGMRFLKAETLEIHKQCHVSSSPQRIQCPVCNSLNYTSWDTLHTHLWRSHKIDMDLYSCQNCDFKTPILSRLINTHSKIHSEERNFKCEQCSKCFKNSKQLKNHRRIHRSQPTVSTTENEFFRCESCGSPFSTQKSLREHICKEKLYDRELFSCTICGKVSSNKSSLKQHMLTHQEATKFKCDHCNFVTNDHNSFRRHKNTHDNNKMYGCKFCDYKCIQSNLYQKHVLRMHPNEANQVIFKCPTCSFSTINQGKYNLHIARHGDVSIRVDDFQVNNNHLKDSSIFGLSNGTEHNESGLNSKIKVKSNLVLTDPTRSITGTMLLQGSYSDIT